MDSCTLANCLLSIDSQSPGHEGISNIEQGITNVEVTVGLLDTWTSHGLPIAIAYCLLNTRSLANCQLPIVY